MYAELIDMILSGKVSTRNGLQQAKIDLCRKYGAVDLPTNSEILASIPANMPGGCAHDSESYRKLLNILRLKPVRSMSGIVVVAVMSSPAPCPHGKCTYCPGGVDNGSPQSYTGKEPAALRGAQGNFDPFKQTANRLEQLRAIGHPTDKVELIIMGGTFPARPVEYQEEFVKRCFDAMNGSESATLSQAHEANAKAAFRCIGLTFETRPDWCRKEHVDRMLQYGATRVELGVQTIYDDVLESVKRGHSAGETIEATGTLKDSGLKACYHMMPGMPGMTPERDIAAFSAIFENPDYRPDMLKIYPTLVIKGTKLYDDWKNGLFEPYTTEQAVDVLAEAKKLIPRWVRLQRMQRDIPAYLIEAGVKKSHLRVLAKKKLTAGGGRCECIRCREVGLSEGQSDPAAVKMNVLKYDASGGTEHFISYDDETSGSLIAYARLRFPSKNAHRPEVRENSASLIRELRVFGQMVEIDSDAHGESQWQHRSYGKRLMDECERLSKESGYQTVLVNSGIGVKPYYSKLGYAPVGVYMGKRI